MQKLSKNLGTLGHAAGAPERLYKLLSDPHTLVHALHLGHTQLQLLEEKLGTSSSAGSSTADRILELIALFG
jgi:hypothetical protein